ncbi:hypothetical protein ACFQU2_23485 [Siccirubricoccus deserti]|uniref:Uncharacterized protein n=1 Tax=Siccirubricoccus deserti TaxID=2013562 RepID=A0A9X0QWK8_9PROT|nr:hypothetical protein [Siccirubricoccus deserti]MBC4014558.1 hypothetical protein [Siccirubricoccus deserti]
MGGLFRAPKPMIVQPAPTTTTAATSTPEQEASQARTEARARASRGLAGTIATSPRGVLDPLPALRAASRKSLLGE